jgi:uncharacterized protein (TIGR00725 family)
MRKLQIGIIGSDKLDLNDEQDKAAWDFAYKVGFALGRAINVITLVNGSTGVAAAAAKGVSDSGGTTVNIVQGDFKEEGAADASVLIATASQSPDHCWPFIYSCDCIISIGGGTETGVQLSLAVDLGIKVLVFSKAGGISSEIFTSLEPTFQKMRTSQIVFLVDDDQEAVDRAKKFALERAKKEIRVETKSEVELPAFIEILTDKKRMAILLLLLQHKDLSANEIADKLKLPLMMAQSYLSELDGKEIILGKKTFGDELLFSINNDNSRIMKLMNALTNFLPKDER